jgi:acetyl-CoA carboxylase biotin carboxylase subunit
VQPPRPIRKLLVANRGEIALRVIRAAHEMGMGTVAVFSDADRGELHVRAAHDAVRIGPPAPRESYLSIDAVVAAAKATGADAVHPGYGFLSENPAFREACDAAKLAFVGPPASAMRVMGDKVSARRTAEKAGVPVTPGSELPDPTNAAAVIAAAEKVGYPLLVKAARGGGGKGIRRVEAKGELAEAVKRAASEAKTSFGSDVVYIERFVEKPRHVEVQVIVDDHGHAVAVGERECSVQRRHQKIIEETPSPCVDDDLRARATTSAARLAASVGYRNAGTVEMLVGADRSFYFMEMNNRLQVEHPITEERYGVDLVHEQLRVAQGLPLSFGGTAPTPFGHAIEARVCAEDAANGFVPSTGTVTALQLPGGPGVRIDGHLFVGQEITLHYDPMLMKLIVHAPTRAAAIARLRRALHETRIGGVTTNVPLLLDVLDDPRFLAGDYDTSLLNGYEPRTRGGGGGRWGGDDLVPVVAAALAAHRRVPARSIPAPGAPSSSGESSWVRDGRRDLGAWPR